MKVKEACRELGWSYSMGITLWQIWKDGGVRFGNFQLKNPEISPSPIYLNLRTAENGGSLTPPTIHNIAMEMYNASIFLLSGVSYHIVVGIPQAGIPLERSFLDLLAQSFRELRWEVDIDHFAGSFQKKGKGALRKITRFMPKIPDEQVGRIDGSARMGLGKRVLILDDVLTGADTKLEAAQAVESAGYKVAAFSVFVDREQGGSERLKRLGYEVLASFKLSRLLDFYVLIGCVTENKRKEILEYIKRTKIA